MVEMITGHVIMNINGIKLYSMQMKYIIPYIILSLYICMCASSGALNDDAPIMPSNIIGDWVCIKTCITNGNITNQDTFIISYKHVSSNQQYPDSLLYAPILSNDIYHPENNKMLFETDSGLYGAIDDLFAVEEYKLLGDLVAPVLLIPHDYYIGQKWYSQGYNNILSVRDTCINNKSYEMVIVEHTETFSPGIWKDIWVINYGIVYHENISPINNNVYKYIYNIIKINDK